MREYEFRGYAKEEWIDSQWLYGYGVTKINYTDGTSSVHLLTPYGDYRVEEESVGQYTGLKDKNGVKIYEGDIVNYGIYGDFKVVYNKSSFKIQRTDHINGNLHLLEECCFDDILVIVNSFDERCDKFEEDKNGATVFE